MCHSEPNIGVRPAGSLKPQTEKLWWHFGERDYYRLLEFTRDYYKLPQMAAFSI